MHGDSYACLDPERVKNIISLWKAHQDSVCDADGAILEYLSLSKSGEVKLDGRVAEVLAILKELDEVPKDAVGFLCSRVCL